MTRRVRAVGLLSGGLDSTLATAMMLEQGVEVLGVNFSTGFCLTDHRRAMRRDDDPRRLRNEALRLGADLSVPIEIVDIMNREYLDLVTHPKHGYGRGANPCIDCRSYMFAKARGILEETGADFVFSGEVLGQRPMSQHMQQLRIVARESGLAGRLLRPLSAQLLDPTIPEQRGLVDRAKLGRIFGRGRKEQLALARRYGLDDFPQPAGGCCFLTDPAFAARFHDFIRFAPGDYEPRYDDFLLLKVGRHFRLPTGTKVVVGRDAADNRFLERHYGGRATLRVRGFEGPTAVVPHPWSLTDAELAAALTARYSDGRDAARVPVDVALAGEPCGSFTVAPAPAELAEAWRV